MLSRLILLLLIFCTPLMPRAETIYENTTFSLTGKAKYAPGFTHFAYASPTAPKGGKITLAVTGTYDNFNRYASRGNPAAGSDTLYDSLFVSSDDEVGSYYPLIAEAARHPADFRWAEVSINPHARFHDGTPITARDVAFTFARFMTEGVPQFRIVYKGASVQAISRLTVRFALPQPDKEKMLSLLSLPVLPEKFWRTHKFNEPLNTPPLSSGPWRISAYKMGQSVIYSRVKDYWAADLPVNKGRFNFDTLRYDYYLDDNVAFEAFKAGASDFRTESSAKKWATQYHGRNFDRHYIVTETRPNSVATDTLWLAFNNEKALFADRRVREALTLAFDFEWLNKALFYQAYKRTDSYFQNTGYAARDYPQAKERELLAPFRNQLPAALFTTRWQPPISDGSGYNRANLLKALSLLQQAGWSVKNQQLVNNQSGKPFRFELLVRGGENTEWILPFRHNLARLGVTLTLRQVDSSQYLRRLRKGDYDMVRASYYATPWPNTSLRILWQSQYIDSSWNTPRVKSPVVDALIDQIATHQGDNAALLPLGRALDRVLLWNYYMIPMWFNAQDRFAWWNKFSHPAILPAYATGIENWWYDTSKAAQLPAQRR